MMTKDGGRRIVTSGGAILADPDALADAAPETAFDPAFWAARGELREVAAGRGAAWFVGQGQRWVLRHYRRGGLAAYLAADLYVWNGEARVRSFLEWRLLAELTRLGLPVPQPVAARYVRRGPGYRCDLITRRIPDARPLSALLSMAPLPGAAWREVGAAIARLHAAGADHADLNAHNILLSGDAGAGGISLIDFDRGRLRTPGTWTRRNLSRLHRSLRKVARGLPPDRFSGAAWSRLLDGYAAG
jgi:3-deoxy-D-manno-octulosonic acid kinase